MSSDDRALVERYFQAMRAKRDGVEDLISLFADDAVYVEPFSAGTPQTHAGKAAIGGFLRAAQDHQPPDMTVDVDRIDVEGGRVQAEWTCTSAAFPQPMRGIDRYEIRDGKIARLETSLTDGGPRG